MDRFLPRFHLATASAHIRGWLNVLWLSALASALVACATTRSVDLHRYGPFPDDSEEIIQQWINPSPGATSATRTVSSVTEPVAGTRDFQEGWLVWAKIREHRPNAQGGTDVIEHEYYFLLRGHEVVSSSCPLVK